MRWGGLISIIIGIYCGLIAYRIIPTSVYSKNKEKAELWLKKFGKIIKVISILLIPLIFLQK